MTLISGIVAIGLIWIVGGIVLILLLGGAVLRDNSSSRLVFWGWFLSGPGMVGIFLKWFSSRGDELVTKRTEAGAEFMKRRRGSRERR